MSAAYSLWLMPREADLLLLGAEVGRLAPEFGEPVFLPHVTIQGDLDMDLDVLQLHAERIAAGLGPLHWPVRAVESSAHFFRCLYLRFDSTPAFEAMQRAAAAATGTVTGLSPYPHLSLAYGQMRPHHEPLLQAAGRRFVGQDLVFDRLRVVRSSKDIPITEWRGLHDYPLASHTAIH